MPDLPPRPEDEDEDEDFEVEEILDYQVNSKKYLIKWLGFPAKHNSWDSPGMADMFAELEEELELDQHESEESEEELAQEEEEPKAPRIRTPMDIPRGFKTKRKQYGPTPSFPNGRDVIVKAEWRTWRGARTW